jgi:hypothetical protein
MYQSIALTLKYIFTIFPTVYLCVSDCSEKKKEAIISLSSINRFGFLNGNAAPGSGQVEFVVDKVSSGQVFSAFGLHPPLREFKQMGIQSVFCGIGYWIFKFCL